MKTPISHLEEKKRQICVVGLGYVGLPLAVLLAKEFDVIGFDVNDKKITELQQGIDSMGEVTSSKLKSVDIQYTNDPSYIAKASCIIVAVPTPVDIHNVPDLRILKSATEVVGRHMSEGSVVVFESTVYPGVTEDICVPILEKASGYTVNDTFFVGYSPERVNPGDTEHTIDKITKVISGSTPETELMIQSIYETITNVFVASSIKVAEAAKVIENIQRDINIALMNELLMLFHKMDISVYDVLDAAGTKWNFLPFRPGLVGGHCIGVDPYYLTYRAQELGERTEMILAGRGINDAMPKFFVEQIIKKAIKLQIPLHEAQVVIYGITFKENVKDIRNSKVVDIYRGLQQYGISVSVTDPIADADEVYEEYGIRLTKEEDVPKADIAVFAVAHKAYLDFSEDDIVDRMKDTNILIVDIKHMFSTPFESFSSERMLNF
jgi:UDP-N-acetyl-D-galactosamine dehydrogenase